MTQVFLWNRRLADRISPRLAQFTWISPNRITAASLISGLIGCFFFAQANRWAMLGGAFFFHLSFFLDNCDGQVARIQKKSSEAGMWFDYYADLVVELALWMALAMASGMLERYSAALAAAAAAGSIMNFLRVVYMRRRKPKPSEVVGGPAVNLTGGLVQTLSNDGDAALLIWIAALIGSPGAFLIGGCFYVWFLYLAGTR